MVMKHKKAELERLPFFKWIERDAPRHTRVRKCQSVPARSSASVVTRPNWIVPIKLQENIPPQHCGEPEQKQMDKTSTLLLSQKSIESKGRKGQPFVLKGTKAPDWCSQLAIQPRCHSHYFIPRPEKCPGQNCIISKIALNCNRVRCEYGNHRKSDRTQNRLHRWRQS